MAACRDEAREAHPTDAVHIDDHHGAVVGQEAVDAGHVAQAEQTVGLGRLMRISRSTASSTRIGV